MKLGASQRRACRPGRILRMTTTLPDPLDSLNCPAHGYLRHAAIHEAGHCVFAIDLGIPFVSVTLRSCEQIWESLQSAPTAMAGCVELEADWRECFADRPEDALDVLIAGSQAEIHKYGHHIPGGHWGDVQQWLIGTGYDLSPDEAQPWVRASPSRVEARVSERFPAVCKVAEELTSGAVADENGTCSFAGTTLAFAQVSELLEA